MRGGSAFYDLSVALPLFSKVYVQRSEVHCERQTGGEQGKQEGGQRNAGKGNDPNQYPRDSSGHGN